MSLLRHAAEATPVIIGPRHRDAQYRPLSD
jgi:hypothetical protein